MQSTTLTKIKTDFNYVDGEKRKGVGIKLYFKDRAEPISFGKEGTLFYAAEFNDT